MSRSGSISPAISSLILLIAFSARAEMPPQVYEQLKKESAEAVVIEALSVSEKVSSETDEARVLAITVEAKILSVERSKSGLKPGNQIRVVYEVFRHTEPRAGPSEPIVVEKGKRYLAYLEGIEPAGTYRITAKGHSFGPPPSAETGGWIRDSGEGRASTSGVAALSPGFSSECSPRLRIFAITTRNHF